MLKERMDILQQASVISQEVSDYVKQVIDLLDLHFQKKKVEWKCLLLILLWLHKGL